METKDISKRTVLVLLILTLVISVVGTWTILSQPATIYKTTEIHQSPGGKVSVGILEGPPAPATPAQPAIANGDGQVSVKILK